MSWRVRGALPRSAIISLSVFAFGALSAIVCGAMVSAAIGSPHTGQAFERLDTGFPHFLHLMSAMGYICFQGFTL